jgi:[ribosomal protein S5]-alanine N-acetyltransferase
MPATQSAVVAAGKRVYLRRPRRSDAALFCAAVRRSSTIHQAWVRAPATPRAFAALIARCRKPDFACVLVCRGEDDALVGVFDLSQIFRGIMQSAYLGYYALAPYSRNGYMAEGLELTLRYAFRVLKLHRVESNIQPANERSIALVRRAGFTLEGYSRRYLKIGGRWRDHERWALVCEDWRRPRKRQ